LEIKTVTPYPQDQETLMDTAQNEQRANARPALATQINNLASYDTIFIGYPIWFGKMPMVLFTLFEQYNFAGKTIIPFSTYGGNGGSEPQNHAAFRSSVTDIKQIFPQSTVLDGLAIKGERVGKAQEMTYRRGWAPWNGNVDEFTRRVNHGIRLSTQRHSASDYREVCPFVPAHGKKEIPPPGGTPAGTGPPRHRQ
jgi:flavodoxin